MFGFLTNVAVLALWRTLSTVGVPIGRFIALQFWLGKSFVITSVWLQRLLLRSIGWLAAPIPSSSKVARTCKRNLGIEPRNWHLGLGEEPV